jgi:hypothetical protein
VDLESVRRSKASLHGKKGSIFLIRKVRKPCARLVDAVARSDAAKKTGWKGEGDLSLYFRFLLESRHTENTVNFPCRRR